MEEYIKNFVDSVDYSKFKYKMPTFVYPDFDVVKYRCYNDIIKQKTIPFLDNYI
jgi:hypothetical protein